MSTGIRNIESSSSNKTLPHRSSTTLAPPRKTETPSRILQEDLLLGIDIEVNNLVSELVTMSSEEERQSALDSYRAKLIESREWEAKLKNLRLEIKDLQKEFDKTEDNIKALQSVGQIIGEVLKQLDDERCEVFFQKRWSYAIRVIG